MVLLGMGIASAMPRKPHASAWRARRPGGARQAMGDPVSGGAGTGRDLPDLSGQVHSLSAGFAALAQGRMGMRA